MKLSWRRYLLPCVICIISTVCLKYTMYFSTVSKCATMWLVPDFSLELGWKGYVSVYTKDYYCPASVQKVLWLQWIIHFTVLLPWLMFYDCFKKKFFAIQESFWRNDSQTWNQTKMGKQKLQLKHMNFPFIENESLGVTVVLRAKIFSVLRLKEEKAQANVGKTTNICCHCIFIIRLSVCCKQSFWLLWKQKGAVRECEKCEEWRSKHGCPWPDLV